MTHDTGIVTAAVQALTVTNPATRDQAAAMLEMWARRDQLDDQAVGEVLDQVVPDWADTPTLRAAWREVTRPRTPAEQTAEDARYAAWLAGVAGKSAEQLAREYRWPAEVARVVAELATGG
jgi:hypothetical protein